MDHIKSRVMAIALTLLFGSVVANAAPVLNPDNGHYYEVIVYPTTGSPDKTWATAEATARTMIFEGIVGHLATITSVEEDTFIYNYVLTFANFNEAWVGGFECSPQPACGWEWVNGEGAIPSVNSTTPYANWQSGEPNNAGGGEFHIAVGHNNVFGWNDEGNLGIVQGYVVEYGAIAETYVEPGVDQLIFAAADVENSENPLTAGVQEVLTAGNVTIDCCRVLDTREGAGHHGTFKNKRFDIGEAVADTYTNPTCVDMPAIPSGTAIMQRWQRATPASRGLDQDPMVMTREHDLGVCVIQSDLETKGVVFSAEETKNVLGYSVNCAETSIEYRPFTGGVAIDPTEIDSPFVSPWTAECDGSRSAKKYSDNVMVLNLRHDTYRKASKPYLKNLATQIQKSVRTLKTEACVDNSEGFLDDLLALVRDAKRDISRRGKAQQSVDALDDATRLALLLSTSTMLPTTNPDPWGSCPGNPKGLIAGRLMSLKFQVCSERVQNGWGDTAKAPDYCGIAPDILDDMPPLPGFPNP